MSEHSLSTITEDQAILDFVEALNVIHADPEALQENCNKMLDDDGSIIYF